MNKWNNEIWNPCKIWKKFFLLIDEQLTMNNEWIVKLQWIICGANN